MPHRNFYLLRDGEAEKLQSAARLREFMESAMARQTSGAFALELRDERSPRWWERVVYALLGLRIPSAVASLSLSWARLSDDSWVYVTFEEDDVYWVPRGLKTDGNAHVRLATEAGEPWLVRRQDCISAEQAISLLLEFHQTRKKPGQIEWLRHELK